MLKLLPCNNEDISALRPKQILSLTGALDVFWLRKRSSKPCYQLYEGDELLGYCQIDDKQLWDFYVESRAIEIFQKLLEIKQITSAIVSTRNPYLLSLLCDHAVKTQSIAYLFYDNASAPEEPEPSPVSALKIATEKDAQWIYKCDDHSRITTKDIDINDLFVLESDGHKIGYGKLSRNPLQFQYSDIGAWVLPQFRSKGYGAAIMRQLKAVCYQRGLIPTCGCDLDNVASKHMVENAGFIATDRMLLVTLN